MPDYLDFMLRLTLFSLLHSVLAAPRFKRYLQQKTGSRLRCYRLCYNLIACLSFVWVMLAWQSTTVLLVAPGAWSLLLHGLQFLALLAGLICLKQTGIASFTGISCTSDNDEQFITTGCYGIVRHPLYLLSILFMVLNPVITTRWITLTIFSTLYFIFGALLEERRMVKLYGIAYTTYQQDVPFLLPIRKGS